MSDTGTFGYGQQAPSDSFDEFNTHDFHIRQVLSGIHTIEMVQVKTVHPGSGSPPATGTVDVLPLVKQIDGNNNVTSQGMVYGLPGLRLGAGTVAFVADPVVNDIGLALCCHRDTSNVRRTGGQPSPPGSRRQYDIADGVYLGSILSAAPTSFVWFDSNGYFHMVDAAGNSVVSSAAGITQTDSNGNVMQMRAGFINMVTTSFRVNGVPVNVP